MSDDIIKRLREAIASGPTPGPWHHKECGSEIVDDGVGSSQVLIAKVAINTYRDQGRHNATYIAAASPDNIAALLDRLDKAEREYERLKHENHNLNWALGTDGYEQMATPEEQAEHDKAVRAHNEFLARLEKGKTGYALLKEDAERYRWLRGDSCPEHSPRWTQWEVRCWKSPRWSDDLRRAELDAAIDAARREK